MSHRQESNTQEGTERDEEQLAAAPGETGGGGSEPEAEAEEPFEVEVDESQDASPENLVPPLPHQASPPNNTEDPDSIDSEPMDSDEEEGSVDDKDDVKDPGVFHVAFLCLVYIINERCRAIMIS